jgi:hypothetical protein
MKYQLNYSARFLRLQRPCTIGKYRKNGPRKVTNHGASPGVMRGQDSDKYESAKRLAWADYFWGLGIIESISIVKNHHEGLVFIYLGDGGE